VPLPASIAALYQSPYLGLLIVGEDRVIDANDAFLRMIEHTREQLASGVIDWATMTPSIYHDIEQKAVAQLREFGTCAPYEKEFIRPNGSRLRVLIGAARLQADPLRWAAYTLDLTEQKRVVAAEQKAKDLEAKYQLVNRLTHEINNPLAAMTFTLHLLNTSPDLPKSAQKLLAEPCLKRLVIGNYVSYALYAFSSCLNSLTSSIAYVSPSPVTVPTAFTLLVSRLSLCSFDSFARLIFQ